jgi:hypothetical protein
MLEGARYRDLKLMEKAGKIWGLKVHPKRYPLKVGNKVVCHYLPDFEYSEADETGEAREVVEDVKGVRTAVYRLKRKMFEAQYMTEIREITKRDIRR